MSNDPQFAPPSRDPYCPGFAAVPLSRRGILQAAGLGFGWAAFGGLARSFAAGSVAVPGALPAHHFAPRAKHVIFLFMDGGVSHVDTFDYKPELAKREGQPAEWKADQLSQGAGQGRVWLGSLWPFSQRGKSGLWVSDLFPHMAGIADDLCVVRSLVGESPLHGAQNLLLHTGRSVGAAPSMGAWISYGLGTDNENLPGYVLLNNDWVPNGGFQNFASGFLPATCQATNVRAKGTPVDNIAAADPAAVQAAKIAFLREQGLATATSSEAAAVEAAIRTFETAARMQTTIPDVCDVAGETEATRRLYGLDRGTDYEKFYALQCLRARKLVEAGVRFVEITCPLTHANNAPWDQHGGMRKYHAENAAITDQPVAALVADLKQRGLLDETIVLWAGEMGRTPSTPGGGKKDGRDHHVSGYTIWLAGGGFKGGTAYGATDEMGMGVVENPLDIHDIHATILHQMGVDHKRLTFRFGGRDVRLTDVHGRVIDDLVA
jgi:hypothetical protein